MMLYVYGIVDTAEFCGGIPRGHHDARVFPLPAADFAAAVSRLAQPPIEASVENIWRHERVLSALMERHAVLPTRFGTIVPDADALVSDLEKRRRSLRQDLRRISGKVEVALRISNNTPGGNTDRPGRANARRAGTPGKAYFEARIERRRGAAMMDALAGAAMQAVREALEQLSVEAVWNCERAPGVPVKASCLVARDGVADFARTVDTLAARHPDITITCTGPWAPYSFVGAAM